MCAIENRSTVAHKQRSTTAAGMGKHRPTLCFIISLLAGAAVGSGVFFLLRLIEKEPSPAGPPCRLAVTEFEPADLRLLFDRPPEPIFSPRGVDRNVAFHVPEIYLPERYKSISSELRSTERCDLARLIRVPELTMPAEKFADINGILPFRSSYTRSAPPFLALAVRFWQFFDESTSIPELVARVVWARLHFNPEMVLDGLMLTVLRSSRPEVRNVPLPDLPQYMPELYVNDEFFAKAREEMHMKPAKHWVPVEVPRNLSIDAETRLWYFREDVHFHVFHWKWHVYYPANKDDPKYIGLDRRGELFVQIHRQFVARYNAERFTNGLSAVPPIEIHEPIDTGYFPKMLHLHGGKGFIGRQANTSFIPGLMKNVQDNDEWVARYEEVLKQRYVRYANGTQLSISGLEGLDLISNLLEGNSLLSPDIDFYGTTHNSLHSSLANTIDPLHDYNENFAVTSAITAVAKDPIFYRIHQYMDNLYEQYKKFLPSYSKEEMTPLPDLNLTSIAVETEGVTGKNELRTYWQKSDLDVSLGLDYTPKGRMYARFTHLQHRPYNYVIQVESKEKRDRKVFVRLVLLVTKDETGANIALDYQRRFSIQMDIFEAVVSPGSNTIRRASKDSALTMDTDAVYTIDQPGSEVRRRNACRCGWPQGLLVPRGTVAGTQYKLLAMITDHADDSPPVLDAVCSDGWILCGAYGSSYYPDRRPMGFPLDRPYRADVKTLDDFLTPNIAAAEVVVKFENRSEGPSDLLPGGVSTTWMP